MWWFFFDKPNLCKDDFWMMKLVITKVMPSIDNRNHVTVDPPPPPKKNTRKLILIIETHFYFT